MPLPAKGKGPARWRPPRQSRRALSPYAARWRCSADPAPSCRRKVPLLHLSSSTTQSLLSEPRRISTPPRVTGNTGYRVYSSTAKPKPDTRHQICHSLQHMASMRSLYTTGYELRRILLLRLSEKGYEQLSDREFGGVGRPKWTAK